MNYIGKKCIIRANRAGVFYGTLTEKNGDEVTIQNCRRIWYWSGAASLSELAAKGVKHPVDSKFCVPVEEIAVLGVIEIIPCTEQAIANIESVPVWKMSK